MLALALSAMVLAALLTPPVQAADGAKIFNETCSACHTIGGGDLAGPDLVSVKGWPAGDVRKAVLRMQEHVGDLQPDQVEGLVAFLREPDVKNAPPAELTPEQKAASAMTGRRLFFGEQRLTNGGTPCFACHAVAGRGGNLAVDLTGAYARRGEAALVSATERPAFPMMKAAYARHAVTTAEAWHLAAFFKEAPSAQRANARADGVQTTAAGIAFAVLAGVAVLFRPLKRR